MGILSILASRKLLLFAGGVAAGLLLPKAAKSKCAHKAAVNVVAKGMRLKDEAIATFEGIKEEAGDVYAEAKNKAAGCCCEGECECGEAETV